MAGVRAAVHLASVGAFVTAKSALWGGAVGAGVGAVTAAVAAGPTAGGSPGNDKPTDEPRGDETMRNQLVRRGDFDVVAPRQGHDRCPECKRTSHRYCWHL